MFNPVASASATGSALSKQTRIVVAALLLCLSASPAVHAKKCTISQANAAEDLVDHLDNWEKIAQARKRFGHCDDGSIAEGMSEAVARVLVDHWDTLPTAAKLMGQDRALKPFVIRHLNTTLNGEDMEKLQALASSSCRPELKRLCADLHTAAAEALR
ncbi:hypothetical protein [Massilia genomosp. 1]|uniref:Secreted protein n=1 Tax=Massilia genomosp. 1 TaxID=2609280 RepID=A0ABX0MEP7_9BURK|nr:hypothetical protein [Massilia genomosp. 1]NHZ60776.1 hypothetical protein [Massilia genomosp. 1]